MVLKARHKRFALIAVGLLLLGSAVTLVLNALNSNMAFFYTPTQVSQGEVPKETNFRVGGLVEMGSIKRGDDGLTVNFVVTDTAKTVPVVYKGVLPDLFKEGKGAVVQGKIGADGIFTASEVLAKHDENYMPPEAAEALKRAQGHQQEQSKTLVLPKS
ncbi:MAG TPA: cytochrome c maturation protein CcmE [Methylotenera sp.]|nr:cytochrome c maturation protein CcmE [Methylotenera sp.]HPH06504.1 cytochrome c maturation protein CcmE [Methylotenera sp.]HPN01995.1 cytochrome c maturation protein CcmE [Methylotenera sp.]